MLNYFPGTPREGQVEAARQLSAAWADHDVFVVQGPPGVGKSALAVMLARWAAAQDVTAAVVAPNSVLQQQYETDYHELPSVWGQEEYRCVGRPTNSCALQLTRKAGCSADCDWRNLQAKVASTRTRLLHTHTYIGTCKKYGYPQLAVFDEAHKLIPFLQEHIGVRLWRDDHMWPQDLRSEDVAGWLAKMPWDYKRQQARKLLDDKAVGAVVKKHYVAYRNRQRWALDVLPLSVRGKSWMLWPRSVKKIVLFSATIRAKDIEELGLSRLRVAYIDIESPIPAAARLFVYRKLVDASFGQREQAMAEVANHIEQIAAKHSDTAGMVHATYDEAAQLRRYLTSDRFMWHDQSNKHDVYTEFRRSSGKAKVLVGSGFYEGVDLAGDVARWQVLTRVPTLSLGDAAVAAKAERDPGWYAWEQAKSLLQAYGRVCRGPEDFGTTYCFDVQFDRLYQHEYLFPKWFREAVRK